MQNKTAAQRRSHIEKLLDSGRIRQAATEMTATANELSDWRLRDSLRHTEDTYKYMLHYFTEGASDKGRERMYSSITEEMRTINDALDMRIRAKNESSLPLSIYRTVAATGRTTAPLLRDYREASSRINLAIEAGSTSPEDAVTRDRSLSDIFEVIMVSVPLNHGEKQLVSETFDDKDSDFPLKCQLISALLVGCLNYYDREKLLLLLDFYDSCNDPRIAARAMTAIVMIIHTHRRRVAADMALVERLECWSDNIVNYPRLREVIVAIIRARDTQRINTKMKDDVIPGIMKMKPEIIDRLRNASSSMDLQELEENPEWEEMLKESGLTDKLQELTEMQLEGGDVMMMAFSNLKSFPFFDNLSNWFLPFVPSHSSLTAMPEEAMTLFGPLFENEGMMCDSDKYSFCFSLSKMPAMQMKAMTSQMKENLSQMKEAMAESKARSSQPEFDREVVRYVRDLYRFYKLFRRRNDFTDPFAEVFDFTHLPVIGGMMSNPEIVRLVGEFYFKRGYHAEALPLLGMLAEREDADEHLWQKIGYCHQSAGDFKKAVAAYSRSELMNGDNPWLLRRMAYCSKMLGDTRMALEYYNRLLDSDPDNISLLLSAGTALLDTGQPEDALKVFYKAYYLDEGKTKAPLRAVAWTELECGKTDKSKAHYEEILADNPEPADYINAGHLYMSVNDRRNAIDHYKNACRMLPDGIAGLRKLISEDEATLSSLGIPPTEMLILLDRLEYEMF